MTMLARFSNGAKPSVNVKALLKMLKKKARTD
jgi:hypothetical protein